MSNEKFNGQYTDMDCCPENPVSWRFFPKRKSGKVGFADVLQELFSQGMEGNLYVQLYRVPQEFPVDVDNNVELLEPEEACKMLADWCHYKLYDQNGKELI